MINSLQKLIREAFNTAYYNHKTVLKESAESLAAKLSPQEKTAADEKINKLLTKGSGYQDIKWDPSGLEGDSQKQQDYIVETLFEKYRETKDNQFRDALASFFSYAPNRKRDSTGNIVTDESPLWKVAKKRYGNSTALERLEVKKPGTLYDFLANSWAKIFEGKYFNELVDKYQDTGTNFGRYLSTYIITDIANQIRDTTSPNSEFGTTTKSIDAPSRVTGKSTDFGDEVTNDTEVEDEDSLFDGPGATDDDYNEDETNLYQIDKENPYASIEAPGTKKHDLNNPLLKIEGFRTAIKGIIKKAKHSGVYDKNPMFFNILEDMIINFLSYKEIEDKYDPSVFVNKKILPIKFHNLLGVFASQMGNAVSSVIPPIDETTDTLSIVKNLQKNYPGLYEDFASWLYKSQGKGNPQKPVDYLKDILKSDADGLTSFVNTILSQLDFDIDIRKIDWQWVYKMGKELKEKNLIAEKKHIEFLSENVETIMDMVYKRLIKEDVEFSPEKITADQKRIDTVLGTYYRALETADFIYFVNYQEGDDNAQTKMYRKSDLELVSDNYFASNDLFGVLEDKAYTRISPTLKKAFEKSQEAVNNATT